MDAHGIVFDLQRFSVHDGPGIRTLVFLKGCPLRCAWCANPESYRAIPEILFDSAKCVGCRACVGACPTAALEVAGETIAFDRGRCQGCGQCAEACTAEARVLSGKSVAADWVVAEAMKDAPFFANSGGGVTLGGGEPLLQPEFAQAILRACQAKGVHTAIETCGHVPWTSFQALLPWTDLFLFDVKHVDSCKHRAHTGVDVVLIQSNLEKLAAERRAVIVRIPVIPSFNADPDDFAAIAKRVAALGLQEIHLLPYHALGHRKYHLLGSSPRFPAVTKIGDSQLSAFRSLIAGNGLRVRVGG